tara:strand:- start:724 stop:924 length:201 start_codon:yes stop_codon:yes gene_type:complete
MPLTNEEILARLVALEEKVAKSNLMMKRPGSERYEKLVDVVCEHDKKISELHVPASSYLRLDQIQE